MLFGVDPAPFTISVGKHQITEIHSTYSDGRARQDVGFCASRGYWRSLRIEDRPQIRGERKKAPKW